MAWISESDGEMVLVMSSENLYVDCSVLSQFPLISAPIPIPPRNSTQTPVLPFPPLVSCREESTRRVTSTSRAERSGDFFPLIESSGERGDLMMLPRKIGPLGRVSRVGTRK